MILEIIENLGVKVVFPEDDGTIHDERECWITYNLPSKMDEFIDGEAWLESSLNALPYGDKVNRETLIFSYGIDKEIIYVAVGFDLIEEEKNENNGCK